MKLKTLAVLAASGLMAASLTHAAPAESTAAADDFSADTQTMQMASADDSTPSASDQVANSSNSVNTASNADGSNGSGNSNSTSANGSGSDQGTPDVASGDDDF